MVQRLTVVLEDGTLTTWGRQGGTDVHFTDPQDVPLPPGPLLDYASGSDSDLVLTSDHRIFGWGNQGLREARIPEATAPVLIHVPAEEKIISLRSHGFASFAITESGKLWIWGANLYGQLGDSDSNPGPREGPDFPSPVIDLAVGFSHVLCLTQDGSVWGWGSDGEGRLGIPYSESEKSQAPFQLLFSENVARVYAGSFHSLVLTKKGALYIWGWNFNGLLGKGESDAQSTHVPHLVFSSGVQEVACGWGHNLALMEDGSLWGWGDNTCRQLGFEDRTTQHVPRKMEIPDMEGEICGVFCGNSFSGVLTDSGNFYFFGKLVENEDHANFGFKKKLFVPWASRWKNLFRWLFLARVDTGSCFFLLPTEVLFNFVLVW